MKKIKEIGFNDVISVRHTVLRQGKPVESCTFVGDNLQTITHFGVYIDEKIVAVISLFLNNNSNFNVSIQYQIRGMAVLQEYQKQGFGALLVKHSEAYILNKKASFIWFNARENAVEFYKNLGYIIVGNSFTIPEVGLHYLMKKEIG